MSEFIEDSVLALSAHKEGYDPMEDRLRAMVRHTIETMFAKELAEALGLAQLWGDDLPIQRCTVHTHRNLLAHAPKHLHEEIGADYRDMIYAETAQEVARRRHTFLRKWRMKCRAVTESLEEAGDGLFTFTRLDPSQWKAARTTNALERLHEEFRRRIKTRTVRPAPETVPMPLWACSHPARSPCPRSMAGRSSITRWTPPP